MAKDKDFDTYVPPKDKKFEQRPRYPTTAEEWRKHAIGQNWWFVPVYGMEHYESRHA